MEYRHALLQERDVHAGQRVDVPGTLRHIDGNKDGLGVGLDRRKATPVLTHEGGQFGLVQREVGGRIDREIHRQEATMLRGQGTERRDGLSPRHTADRLDERQRPEASLKIGPCRSRHGFDHGPFRRQCEHPLHDVGGTLGEQAHQGDGGQRVGVRFMRALGRDAIGGGQRLQTEGTRLSCVAIGARVERRHDDAARRQRMHGLGDHHRIGTERAHTRHQVGALQCCKEAPDGGIRRRNGSS